MLPFTLSFLDDVVPDNYRLPVTVSVSGGDAAAPTIYRPLYKDWEIQKFVNSNRLDAFGKDGAEVVVTPQEEGGNPYLDDLTYVDFAFIVNKYTNDQCSLADLRDARSVTLTDTLPTYTDRNGVSRIAVFDADQNPGWTLSEDGKTVSRTYTLPRSGDPNLFGASGRGSEFPVRLRSAITPPEGYTVYYTTSPEVCPHSMEEMVSADIWAATVSDYASVTAFKFVAGEGTELAGNSRFQVRIPVCAPKTFDEDSMALLRAKVDQDQASGTVSWLQAVNAFGFRTVQAPTVKESNTVWARVCFAGFCVKKVNGATPAALPGAEFTLTDAAGDRRRHGRQRCGRPPAVPRADRGCLRPAQDRRPRDRSLLRPRRVPAPLRRRPPRPPQTPQPEALRQHPRPIHNAAGAFAPAAFFGKMPGLSASSCKVLLHMLHFLLEKRTGGTAWIGIVSLRSSRASLRTTTLRRSGCAASWTRRAHISST